MPQNNNENKNITNNDPNRYQVGSNINQNETGFSKKVSDLATNGLTEEQVPKDASNTYNATKKVSVGGKRLIKTTTNINIEDKKTSDKENSENKKLELRQSAPKRLVKKSNQTDSSKESVIPNFRKNNNFNSAILKTGLEDDDINDMENSIPEDKLNESENNDLNNNNTNSNDYQTDDNNNIPDTIKTEAKNIIKDKAKKGIMAFIKKNPYVLLIGGLALIFIILLLLVLGADTQDSKSGKFGLSGYEYLHIDNLCETVKVYNPDTGTYTRELDFETEYIPGVVYKEVGAFTDAPELLKLFSVAARSFAIRRLSDDCTIEGSARVQAFEFNETVLNRIIADGHPIAEAAKATYGLVATKEGKLLTTYYDAACYQGQDEEYYHIGYGEESLGTMHIQKIPKTWNNVYLNYYVNQSISNNRLCYQGHGWGISQVGAYYLATVEGYDMQKLMQYYNGEVELYSIYEGISTNYTTTTSTGSNDIITMALRDFLKSKGTSTEALNEYILGNVVNSGVGTREAVVSAAVSLVGGLYQNYQARLPYTYGGQHGSAGMYSPDNRSLDKYFGSFYGADPDWGTAIHSSGLDYYLYPNNPTQYTRYGPDCSGFVSWALHNAGFNFTGGNSGGLAGLGAKKAFNGTELGKPGDLIYHPGHIMLLIGVDKENKLYYIAHASSGANGVIISTMSFSKSGEYVIDMDSYYGNEANKLNLSTEEFKQKFRAGYIDGYTGESSDIQIPEVDNEDSNKYDDIDINDGIYFVGDSRTVGLCSINGLSVYSSSINNQDCLAKEGESYNWFTNNLSTIKNTSKGNIVINMGVNDIAGINDTNQIEVKAEKYFEQYLSLAKSFDNKIIYIVSVNPVYNKTNITNSIIETYNNKMKQLISNSNQGNLRYIDTYNNISFVTTDGLHYNSDTYIKIYEYILGRI